jgi:hypothetical protein
MLKSLKLRAAMLAAGAGLALTPLVLQAAPAGAATFTANSQGAVTFVDIYGNSATCQIYNRTTHNTDNSNQPYTLVDAGWGGDSSSCFDYVVVRLQVSYKDDNGARRNVVTSNESPGTLKVEGTYSSITSTVSAEYSDCDAVQSASCTARAVSNPK